MIRYCAQYHIFFNLQNVFLMWASFNHNLLQFSSYYKIVFLTFCILRVFQLSEHSSEMHLTLFLKFFLFYFLCQEFYFSFNFCKVSLVWAPLSVPFSSQLLPHYFLCAPLRLMVEENRQFLRIIQWKIIPPSEDSLDRRIDNFAQTNMWTYWAIMFVDLSEVLLYFLQEKLLFEFINDKWPDKKLDLNIDMNTVPNTAK